MGKCVAINKHQLLKYIAETELRQNCKNIIDKHRKCGHFRVSIAQIALVNLANTYF